MCSKDAESIRSFLFYFFLKTLQVKKIDPFCKVKK
jgi:hypothetical protein